MHQLTIRFTSFLSNDEGYDWVWYVHYYKCVKGEKQGLSKMWNRDSNQTAPIQDSVSEFSGSIGFNKSIEFGHGWVGQLDRIGCGLGLV